MDTPRELQLLENEKNLTIDQHQGSLQSPTKDYADSDIRVASSTSKSDAIAPSNPFSIGTIARAHINAKKVRTKISKRHEALEQNYGDDVQDDVNVHEAVRRREAKLEEDKKSLNILAKMKAIQEVSDLNLELVQERRKLFASAASLGVGSRKSWTSVWPW